jgi:hypothetical protein
MSHLNVSSPLGISCRNQQADRYAHGDGNTVCQDFLHVAQPFAYELS